MLNLVESYKQNAPFQIYLISSDKCGTVVFSVPSHTWDLQHAGKYPRYLWIGVILFICCDNIYHTLASKHSVWDDTGQFRPGYIHSQVDTSTTRVVPQNMQADGTISVKISASYWNFERRLHETNINVFTILLPLNRDWFHVSNTVVGSARLYDFVVYSPVEPYCWQCRPAWE